MSRSSIGVLESINSNLRTFFKDKTSDEFIAILDVICLRDGFEESINGEYKDVIHEFLDEFFGLEEWFNVLKDINSTSYFRAASGSTYNLLDKVRVLILPLSIKFIMAERLNTSNKEVELAENHLEKCNLKLDLHLAYTNSYDVDGVFYKNGGWCNISDVLVKYNLLDLEDE